MNIVKNTPTLSKILYKTAVKLRRQISLALCVDWKPGTSELTPEAYQRAEALGFTRKELDDEAELQEFLAIW